MEDLRNAKTSKPSLPEQDEDEFRTAPNSPSLNGETHLFNPDLCYVQKHNDVPNPDTACNGKKRRYIDNTKAPEPRKVSRNIVESHSIDYSEMDDVSCHDLRNLRRRINCSFLTGRESLVPT